MTSQVANESGHNSFTPQHRHRESGHSGTQSNSNYGGREDGGMSFGNSESMNHPYEYGEDLQHSGPPVTIANTIQSAIIYPGCQTSPNAECSVTVQIPIAFGGSEKLPGSSAMVPRLDHDSTGVLQHPQGWQLPPPLDTVESHAFGEYPHNPMPTLRFIDPLHSPWIRAEHDLGQVVPSACSSDYRQLNIPTLSTTTPPPLLPVEQPQREIPEDDGSEPEPPYKRSWKMIPLNALVVTGTKYFIPQYMYKPISQTDRSRYVDEITFQRPIMFYVDDPHEWGIPLEDTRSKTRENLTRLRGKDDLVFAGCGPSASIRIQWKGYQAWNRQISTKNYRKSKGQITRAKLAEHVAECVTRFINERQSEHMDDDGDKRFRIGEGHIVIKDLILVSLHHISKGSWQPQLRLRRLPWKAS